MSNLLQEVLSLEWFMQGVLASYARGSVIKVAEYMTQQWLVIRVVLRLSKLSHARGSVSCKGFCHLVQGVLPISCKWFCLWSSSILGPMQGVLSISCKSICLMQGVLASKDRNI